MGKLTVTLVSIAIVIVYGIVWIANPNGYFGMILTFVIVAAIGVTWMLVIRYAVTITRTVTLTGVGVGYALRSVSQSIWAAEDHLVGFPSGTFEVKTGDESNSVIATEFVPKGSGGIVLSFIRIPGAIAATIFLAFAQFGVFGFFIGFFLAAIGLGIFLMLFVVPLAIAWLVEIAFKPLLKSQISVTASEADDAVTLEFRFRGASALLVMKRILRAFDTPVLPPRYAGMVPIPATSAPAIAT
ncbi:hypothetical protein [Microbacterium memoriense]|uniref:Uncharacterized protein n=1 Tax=Microbacterium memoriense TaxID=2978350 RepID=A0ABT2PDE7_9MICO|nr:hypothetical protein [Microbacterium memoriense]MCT9002613.1 hypothetical protein [Microbacterium memoriense]